MSAGTSNRPRVGIPWRTAAEEQAGERKKLDYYFQAVEKAGGEAKTVSLRQSGEALEQQIASLDAFVLPGSPSDVDPALYGEKRDAKTEQIDQDRDRTDLAILDHAFAERKPVLAICYGCQVLNVHRKGTLVQDIRTANPGAAAHGKTDLPPEARSGDAGHAAKLERGSRLAALNESEDARINSSHHQAIAKPGEGLKVTAVAPDGTIEGVEWAGDSNWVLGVQWHPERMAGDAFAERIFLDFVTAAREARAEVRR